MTDNQPTLRNRWTGLSQNAKGFCFIVVGAILLATAFGAAQLVHPSSSPGVVNAGGSSGAVAPTYTTTYTSVHTLSTSANASVTTSTTSTTTVPPPSAPSPPSAAGTGLATCSPGYTVVFGGRTEPTSDGLVYDAAVCANATGMLEYYGIDISSPKRDIRLPACQSTPDVFRAVVQKPLQTYVIDGSVGTPSGSSIIILDAKGTVTWRAAAFASVMTAPRTGLASC